MAKTVDAILKETLDDILPTWNSVKEEESDTVQESYIVFNYSTYGTGYADDDPTGEVYVVQVHLFTPLSESTTSFKKQIRSALHEAGFTWPETVNATDDKGRHLVFECQYVEGLDL